MSSVHEDKIIHEFTRKFKGDLQNLLLLPQYYLTVETRRSENKLSAHHKET